MIYEPCEESGGVLIRVPIPTLSPEGTRVVIRHASVAGSDVALGKSRIQVAVGFNHAKAPRGPVFEAACAGDVPALQQFLAAGSSTEEIDPDVSGAINFWRLAHRPRR